MYSANDTVRYATHGICKVLGVSSRKIGQECIECYTLEPVDNTRCNIIIPVTNKAAAEKIQHILSVEEVYSLIRAMPGADIIWIENTAARRKRYAEILENGDRMELIRLIKTLYLRRKELLQNGKKLHMTDENYMQDAERVLYDEFSHVLKMERDNVLPFVMEQLRNAAARHGKKQKLAEKVSA